MKTADHYPKIAAQELIKMLNAGEITEQHFVDHLLCRELTVGRQSGPFSPPLKYGLRGEWDILTDAYEEGLISRPVYLELRQNAKFSFIDPSLGLAAAKQLFEPRKARAVQHEAFVREIKNSTSEADLSLRRNPDKIVAIAATATAFLSFSACFTFILFGLLLTP